MYKGWGQSSVTGQRERSNICLLDVREHLHWWVEESLPPLSNQERRRTAEKDIRPPPPPPPPPPTPDLSRQQPAHTHTAHGLHENILNSIRICKFHELAVLLLNILSGCQINLGCNVWHSEPLFKTETNFSPTNLSLSHSRSDLPVSSPQNLIILEIWGENVTPQDCLLSSGTWREIEKKKEERVCSRASSSVKLYLQYTAFTSCSDLPPISWVGKSFFQPQCFQEQRGPYKEDTLYYKVVPPNRQNKCWQYKRKTNECF